MNTIKTITLLFACLLLINCSNDDDGATTVMQPEAVVKLLTTLNFAEDSDIEYLYDIDGKLIEMNDGDEITYDSSGRLSTMRGRTIQYNDQGQITAIVAGDPVIILNQIFYHEDGKIDKMTRRGSSGDEVLTSVNTYESDLITEIEITSNTEDQLLIQFIFEYNTDGLLSKVTFKDSEDFGQTFSVETTEFMYDDKINPYAVIAAEMLGGNGWNTGINEGFELTYSNFRLNIYYVSPHNVVEKKITTSSTLDVDTYEYTYDEDNYPSSVNISNTFINGSGTEFNTGPSAASYEYLEN